jgi:polysaccharide biosynthesis protein PslG
MSSGKLNSCALLLLILFLVLGSSQPLSAQKEFGLQMNSGVVASWQHEPWPAVPFGSLRLWDASVAWYQINTADGVYDWSVLDAWLASAQTTQSVLYTFGNTPAWASSNPTDSSCVPAPGSCDPPNDLNADGSGSDQHWKDFVTAIVMHNHNSKTGHIDAWEVWNEPYAPWEWTGTYAQMVRMASDATAIIKGVDPNATILSPSFLFNWGLSLRWLDGYLAAGGGEYADVIALHGYVKVNEQDEPEDLVDHIKVFRAILNAHNQGGKPIWDTEASWGDAVSNHIQDPDMQAAWLARFYIIHRSHWIARLYWFSYNSTTDFGTLWIPNEKDHSRPGTLLKPGKAYGVVEGWLTGAHITTRCSPSATVWKCGLNRNHESPAIIVWDTGERCSNGSCQTVNYAVDSQYVKYTTLDGETFPITDGVVPVGAKPVLVQRASEVQSQ